MTLLLVVLLALLWGGVFVPAVIRVRHDSSPIVTVSLFRRGMEALGGNRPGTAGRYILVPRPRQETASSRRRSLERRRRIFAALLTTVCLTAAIAVVTADESFVKANLIADVLLGAYILVLLQLKSQHPQVRPARAVPRGRAPVARGDQRRPAPSVRRVPREGLRRASGDDFRITEIDLRDEAREYLSVGRL